MNLKTASGNVRTMDEAVKYYSVPDKYNEEYVEADILTGKNQCF